MKNTMTKGEIRHELAKAKKELKDAWICGEGYEYDQNFIVCYKDGTVLETREANERLPQTGIIGIQFFGTDAHYTVGYEMYNGEKVLIEDESEDACYRVEYLPLTSTEATAETVESVEETTVSETETVEETAEQEETEVKTKMYWAAVRNKETNQLEVIKRDDYSSKKDFAHDLRANGYAVRFISTPDKFDEDCENYYWECEKRQNVRKCVSESKERMEIAEQETELNTEVAEVEAEQTAENKTETTAENITVSGTNQDNINVLIVADVINAFEMITHTGYFDTS